MACDTKQFQNEFKKNPNAFPHVCFYGVFFLQKAK